MQALPKRSVTNAAWVEAICWTRNPFQVSIYAIGTFWRRTGEHVTHHEANCMVLPVLLLDESIHALDYIFAA